jgi:hypothetical protein
MADISVEDRLCVFFLKKPNTVGLEAYDKTLDLLVPRIREPRCQSLVSCFYVNSNKYGSGVRLSCLVPRRHENELLHEIKFITNELNLIQEREPKGPENVEWYTDKELEMRYRFFLSLQNTIGLEMLNSDRVFARRATAFVRCRTKPWEKEFRLQFEPVLVALSPTFNSLDDTKRDSFFEDLSTKPKPNDYAWFHQLVNLILTQEPKFCRLSSQATIEEINDCLRLLDLPITIPDSWKSGIPK